MQPLRASERPVSHYRNGKLRAEEKPALALPFRLSASDRVADSDPDPEIPRGKRLFGGKTRTLAALRPEPRLTRPDPAPSRFAYRMERLWLTPLFRVLMRVGVPVAVVVGGLGLWFSDAGHRAAITAKVADLRSQIENRPEFMVRLMSVDGASQPVADAVRAMLPVTLPASSFAIDLEAMRASVEQIDAVESVRLKVRSGGVLSVEVTERQPAILWRTGETLEMLDATGHRVATLLRRGVRQDLPVIAGAGAEAAVPEALQIVRAAAPIMGRVRGLVRIGERRWDMVLDRDQRILLPETNAVEAVEQIVAIDAAEELLARDVARVDLRNAARPTVRLTEAAVTAVRKINEVEAKVAGQ